MSTFKLMKWLGFTLFCLGILSIPLAQTGLRAPRDFQDRSSQKNPVLEEGEQMDLPLPGRDVAETAPDAGEDLTLTGGIAAIDPTNGRLASADGKDGYYLAGVAKMLDPSGRIRG